MVDGRIYKKLRGSTTTRTPVHCLFVDTESFVNDTITGTAQTFRLGTCAYINRRSSAYAEKQFVFHTLDEFYDIIDELLSSASIGKLYIYAHNQKYDFVQLRCSEWMIKRGFVQKNTPLILPRFIRATYIRYRENGQSATVEFRDSYNIFPMPLADIGRAMGIPKLDHDANWNKIPDSELTEYCMRDVNIIKAAMCMFFRFIDDNDLGNCRPTISGQAYETYKHRFMFDDIYTNTAGIIIDMARESYKGARNDAFYIGDTSSICDRIYQLDFNSMYGSVMYDKRYPTEYVGCQFGCTDSNEQFITDTENGYVSIADVLIETDEPVYSVTYKGRTVFPVGTFQITLTQPELDYAVQHNHVKKWYRRNIYRSAYIFSRYVEFFSELKEKYTKERDLSPPDSRQWAVANIMVILSKAFITNLYGKFGQRARDWHDLGTTSDVGSIEEYDHEDKKIRTIMSINGHAYFVDKTKGETRESIPEIAAFVTAYGRMKLWNAMKTCGEKEYFYTDTDSLYVTQKGYDQLLAAGEVHPWRMGRMKIEGVHSHIEIFTVKDLVKYGSIKPIYKRGNGDVCSFIRASDEQQTLKGVPKNAEKIGKRKYKGQRFSSIREGLANGMTTTRTMEFDLTKGYDKGIIGDDGWVTPFELKGEQE